MTETVNHPAHYGGADNPYEPIKLIERWGLGFKRGNALKYICRAGRKSSAALVEDLRKATWYLERHIASPDPAVADAPLDVEEAADAWDLPPNVHAAFCALANDDCVDAVRALRDHLGWLGVPP